MYTWSGMYRVGTINNIVATITEQSHHSNKCPELQIQRDDHFAVQDYRSHQYYTANDTLFNKYIQSTSINNRDPINKARYSIVGGNSNGWSYQGDVTSKGINIAIRGCLREV